MKRHTAMIVALLFVLSLILTACGGGGSEATGGEDNEGAEKNITLRFATWDTGELLKIQQEIGKKFEEQNPGVKVQVEAYADGFDQKLAASFGAKNPPDMMYMWNFPAYHESLEPLDSFIENDTEMDMDDFYDGLFNYMRVNNELYGLPIGFTTRVVYYNKKLFDEAGLPYPEKGWTWEDFQDMTERLTNVDTKQYGYAFHREPDPYDYQGFIWSNGSSFISDDGTTIDGYMNSPETAEVLQMFGDMGKSKTALLTGGNEQQSATDIFRAGNLAMWESGVWPLQSFLDADIDVGTIEPPSFGDKPVKGVMSASAISIAKDSQHKEMAWEFVKFYTSAEAIKMRTADLPVRQSVVEELEFDQDPLYEPFYTMLEKSEDTPAFLLNPNWNEIQKHLSAAINAALVGEDAQEALNAAVNDAQRFLDE